MKHEDKIKISREVIDILFELPHQFAKGYLISMLAQAPDKFLQQHHSHVRSYYVDQIWAQNWKALPASAAIFCLTVIMVAVLMVSVYS